MRIANWNVQRALPSQRRFLAIRDALTEVGADIYVVTETHVSMVPRHGFNGVVSTGTDRLSTPGERWASIWSASPPETLAQYVSDPARCVAARLPDSEIGEVVVFACVLPWVGSSWHGHPSSGGEAFTSALDAYRTDWRRLAAAFPRATLVVAGDFNQDLAPRHYYGSGVQRAALGIALDDAGLRPVTSGELDPIARHSPPHACIDHICICRAATIEVTSTSRWPDSPSPIRNLTDHFGVAVDVQRGRPPHRA